MIKVGNLYNFLRDEFENASNILNAAPMSSYMKDQFNFYGIKSPKRRTIISRAWKRFKITSEEELYAMLEVFWKQEEREWQYAAMDLMSKCKKLYSETTVGETEKLITSKSWWDTVDFLASNVIGDCFLRFPHQRDDYIKKWLSSKNTWLIRTCLIFQLKYKDSTDFELLMGLISNVKGSQEFFINKAAGWALRQYSKHDPIKVRTFIDSHPDLHPLIIREGSKYC